MFKLFILTKSSDINSSLSRRRENLLNFFTLANGKKFFNLYFLRKSFNERLSTSPRTAFLFWVDKILFISKLSSASLSSMVFKYCKNCPSTENCFIFMWFSVYYKKAYGPTNQEKSIFYASFVKYFFLSFLLIS